MAEEGVPFLDASYWILQTIAMMVTALLIPRLIITSVFGAVLTVVSLAFVNATLWDAALFFSIPNMLSMQALLLFLANGLLFWILVKILPGIEVQGLLPALAAPVVFTLTSLFIGHYLTEIDWRALAQEVGIFFETLRTSMQPSAVPTPS